MTPRLPVAGGDTGVWADILNEYLQAGHDSDGSTKNIGPVFNVKDDAYGAVGNGVDDDTAAIQAAIDVAGQAGGGTLYIPHGVYILNTSGTSQGALYIKYDNIVICGDGPSSVLKSTLVGQGVFHPQGSHRVSLTGTAGWYDYRSFFPISVPTRWSDSVTCVNPGDAANFAVDDFVYVRTGQTTGVETFQPDAEVNKVVSVDAGTGVVTFAWPLLKAYEQEYYAVGSSSLTTTTASASATATSVSVVDTTGFVTGDEVTFWGAGGSFHKAKLTSVSGGVLAFSAHPVSTGATIANGASVSNAHGPTTTTVTTRLATLGIANVTSVTIQNLLVHDLTVDNSSVTNGMANFPGGQLVGFRVERVNHIGKGCFFSMGNVRYAWFLNNRAHMSTGGRGYLMAFGPGSGEYIVSKNLLTNEDYNQGITFSEGTDSGIIESNIIKGQVSADTTDNGISVQTRSQGIVIRGNRIVNAGGNGIYVDSFCPGGGLIEGNTFEGTFPSGEINIGSPGWVLGNNSPKGYESKLYADIGTQPEQLWARVKADSVSGTITSSMGTVPTHAIVTKCWVYTNNPFNSSGTDQVQIGTSGNHGLFMGNVDVSAGHTLNTPPAVSIYTTAPQPVSAYYVAGGGVPTTGECVCLLEYRRVRDLTA